MLPPHSPLARGPIASDVRRRAATIGHDDPPGASDHTAPLRRAGFPRLRKGIRERNAACLCVATVLTPASRPVRRFGSYAGDGTVATPRWRVATGPARLRSGGLVWDPVAAGGERAAGDRLREYAHTTLAGLAGAAVVARGARVGAIAKDADRSGRGTCAAVDASVRVALIVELADVLLLTSRHRLEAE